jgi:hypothetical protein
MAISMHKKGILSEVSQMKEELKNRLTFAADAKMQIAEMRKREEDDEEFDDDDFDEDEEFDDDYDEEEEEEEEK